MKSNATLSPATRRPLSARAVEASALAVAPDSVGIMLSLMSAHAAPDRYVIRDGGDEIHLEPVIYQ